MRDTKEINHKQSYICIQVDELNKAQVAKFSNALICRIWLKKELAQGHGLTPEQRPHVQSLCVTQMTPNNPEKYTHHWSQWRYRRLQTNQEPSTLSAASPFDWVWNKLSYFVVTVIQSLSWGLLTGLACHRYTFDCWERFVSWNCHSGRALEQL